MPKSTHSSKWLSIGKAAQYLGLSVDTLRRWEKKGYLKPHRSPSNHRFYTPAQLDAVLKSKTKAPKSVSSSSFPKTRLIIITTGITILILIFLLYQLRIL